MPYLKKLVKNDRGYYYLFHTVRNNGKYDKLSKYVGKEKPGKTQLEKMKKEFLDEINNKKDKRKGNLVELLQKIQQKHGYLPLNELKKLSRSKNIPGTDIFSVVSFYSQFSLEKPAKYTIYVCTGTACHVKGSEDLLKTLERTLGIKRNTTTNDRLIRLETVNCIGACAKAPAIMINDKVYGKVTREKITELIKQLK
ncbi:MAG: NAD(P)H-dependent oxidoreductase subunit E [Nanoarchaeota archaeon]